LDLLWVIVVFGACAHVVRVYGFVLFCLSFEGHGYERELTEYWRWEGDGARATCVNVAQRIREGLNPISSVSKRRAPYTPMQKAIRQRRLLES
jgi:hypothetical protein